MSATEKLKARLFGESQYEELDVDERAALVAIVEALEVIRDARDEGGSRLISGWEANAIATTVLASLEEVLLS